MRYSQSLFLILLLLPFSAYRAQENADGTFKRRVAILSFHNNSDNKSLDYLQASIAEAYITPLLNTENFEIIPRSEVKAAQKDLDLNIADLSNETIAARIGREAGADVVLMGSFTLFRNQLKIQAKALDASNGRIKVANSTNTRNNTALFDSIDRSAQTMAEKMAKALPPLKQRVIREERLGAWLEFSPLYKTVLTDGSEKAGTDRNLEDGLAFRLSWAQNTLLNIHPVIIVSYFQHVGRYSINSYKGGDISGGLAYPVTFAEDFTLMPRITGGFVYATLNTTTGNRPIKLPRVGGELLLFYRVFNRLHIHLSGGYEYIPDEVTDISTLSFGMGLGVEI